MDHPQAQSLHFFHNSSPSNLFPGEIVVGTRACCTGLMASRDLGQMRQRRRRPPIASVQNVTEQKETRRNGRWGPSTEGIVNVHQPFGIKGSGLGGSVTTSVMTPGSLVLRHPPVMGLLSVEDARELPNTPLLLLPYPPIKLFTVFNSRKTECLLQASHWLRCWECNCKPGRKSLCL